MIQTSSRRKAREAAREAARDLAHEIGRDSARDPGRGRETPPRERGRELSPLTEEAAAAARADRALAQLADTRRLSQANRGLRMILVAAVFVVLASWGGALGSQYIKLMQIEALLAADADALRVMCAVDPPDERAIGRMHICETVAGAGAPVLLGD